MTTRPHGYARYRLDGCRCYTCAAARSRYDENRTKAITAGTWQPWTSASPVREHLAHLRSCGMGLRTIASLARVDRQRLHAVIGGRPERGTPPQDKVRPALAAAVLAVEVTLETLAPTTLMSPVGVRRRCHALVALGWPQQHLAAHLGMTPSNFSSMLARPHVLVRRHLQVLAMYDALWKADPAAAGATSTGMSRARAYAADRGWAPPGAWDDDTIDIPDALPDWTGVCGTPAGVSAHKRLGVPVCDPCRGARAEARRASRAAA
jgi:hypothetical protein